MIYFDTSVLVALLTNESTAASIRQWYAENNDQIIATSDWTLTEFCSAISLKERTKQLTVKQANAVRKAFDTFINDGGIHLLEVTRQSFRNAATLVRSLQGLRAGDALHLAVILEVGIKNFATLDKLLAEKAIQARLKLEGINNFV